MSSPLSFRLRPDLIVQPQDPASGTWVVKDPISLRFFLFGGDEQFIMSRLNGQNSLQEIVDDFARQRAPKHLTLERLHSFLATLHRNGLACSDAPRQGQTMLAREAEQRWREKVLGWTNVLAIRLPGFNPDAALDHVLAWVRWCFSWWCLALAMMLCAIAVGVVIVDWDSFRLQWPRLQEFVNGRNLIWLMVALATTKCLHELAHALTCKYFGGRCHEMGVILLVFIPCLYCNVTDAWMLRSRWQRIAISAAGMIAELFLASLAVLLWRYTQPGPLNSICLNVIVVCGVSTLLFNGNPLLKYDGYYILSDLIRMPNLWQESRSVFYRRLGRWFLTGAGGEELPADHPRLLLLYAISSIVYRTCLTIGILLFLYRALHPMGLDVIVLLIAVSILAQGFIVWSTPIVRWWANPEKMKRLNKGSLFIAGVIGGLLVGGTILIPLPASVTAPALLQPRDVVKVFITTPGVVVQAVAEGEQVEKGQVLAVLEDADLRNQWLVAGSALARSQARVRSLQMRLDDDAEVAAQLAVAQEILADFAEQARLRDKEFNSLTVTAPAPGTVLPAPAVPSSAEENELPTWTGSPLAPENRGSFLERGTLLCEVGDPNSCEAIALIDETDLPYVKSGQAVRLRLEHALTDPIAGRVVEIAEVNADTVPQELVSQHDVAADQNKSGGPKPIRTLYQARVEFDGTQIPVLTGARGKVRISIAPQTVAEKLERWARRTFEVDPKS